MSVEGQGREGFRMGREIEGEHAEPEAPRGCARGKCPIQLGVVRAVQHFEQFGAGAESVAHVGGIEVKRMKTRRFAELPREAITRLAVGVGGDKVAQACDPVRHESAIGGGLTRVAEHGRTCEHMADIVGDEPRRHDGRFGDARKFMRREVQHRGEQIAGAGFFTRRQFCAQARGKRAVRGRQRILLQPAAVDQPVDAADAAGIVRLRFRFGQMHPGVGNLPPQCR